MMDYLNKLCESLGIGLVYTDDDYIALSPAVKGEKVYLKADKLFSGCPERVAMAIIGYYTGSGDESSNLRAIKSYILDNVVTVEYTIVPTDEKFRSLLLKDNETGTSAEIAKPKAEVPQDKEPKEKTPKEKAPKEKTAKTRASGNKTSKGRTSKASLPKDDTSSLVELEIASMTKRGFYGTAVKVDPNEAIKVSSDDVVELDIEVDGSKL